MYLESPFLLSVASSLFYLTARKEQLQRRSVVIPAALVTLQEVISYDTVVFCPGHEPLSLEQVAFHLTLCVLERWIYAATTTTHQGHHLLINVWRHGTL